MELSSLVDFGEFAPALAAGHPFLPEGVQAPILWSSTSYERQPNQVWRLSLSDGAISANDKITVANAYGWAVRDAFPPPTQCSDGIDNDNDGAIDLDDRQCRSADQNSEKNPKR